MDNVFSITNETFNPISASPVRIDRNDEKIQCFYSDQENEKLLVEVNLRTGITNIFPTNTNEDSPIFLTKKYDEDINFVFEEYDVSFGKNKDGDDTIDGLPKGFTKTIKYGLGLERQYKIIVAGYRVCSCYVKMG